MTRYLCILKMVMLLTLPVWAQSAPQVAMHAGCEVAGPEVLLSEVAHIQAEPELYERLAAVTLGSAPVAGTSRTISAGYVKLRLRRFGFDPEQLELAGASVEVHRAASAPAAHERHEQAAEQPAAASVIRRGQIVKVALQCGGVTIHTTGRACGDAAIGQLLSVTLQKSGRSLAGTVTAAGTVTLAAPRSSS